MNSVDLSTLKATLPNFPDQVLETWLQPYANSEGWPPIETALRTLSGRWHYLLKRKPLTYWQALTWTRVKRHISLQELDHRTQDILMQIVFGAVQGQYNLYSASISDLSERFKRILNYFGEHGIFPIPPVLLVEDGKLTILDGNHRMSAYFYAYGYFALNRGADLQLRIQELQSYWIANQGE